MGLSILRALLLLNFALVAWPHADALAHGNAPHAPSHAAPHGVQERAAGKAIAHTTPATRASPAEALAVASVLSPSHCPPGSACGCTRSACITVTPPAASSACGVLVPARYSRYTPKLAPEAPFHETALRLSAPPRAPPVVERA